jgi:hypothetical protein
VLGVLDRVRNPTTGVSGFLAAAQSHATLPVPLDNNVVPQVALLQSSVHVAPINCPLSQVEQQQLESSIHPVADCKDGIGMDVFGSVLQKLTNMGY